MSNHRQSNNGNTFLLTAGPSIRMSLLVQCDKYCTRKPICADQSVVVHMILTRTTPTLENQKEYPEKRNEKERKVS